MDQPTSHRRNPKSYTLDITSFEIRVDRFIVPIPSEEGSNGTVRRGETLERGWREVNTTPVDEGQDIEGERGNTCGHVSRVDRIAALWVFSDVAGRQAEIDGLECTESRTLDIRTLFTCAAHGHDLLCLTPGRKCDVTVTMGDAEPDWRMYAQALRDKILWKEGRRAQNNEEHSYDLWPVSPEKMVLVPQPPAPSSPSINTGTRISTSMLRPLNLPAVHVGTYSPTDAQVQSLESSFTELLGSAYDVASIASRSGIDAMMGYAEPPWGVYWVCEDLRADPRVESLKGKVGVMTIWPTHLVTTAACTTPPRPAGSTSAVKSRSFPESSELMDLSLGFYDFMAAYEAPVESIEEITPETNGAVDSPLTLRDQMAPHTPSLAGGPGSPFVAASPVGSDMDDLFGDHSPTPPNGAWVEQQEGPSFDNDVEMASPPADRDLQASPPDAGGAVANDREYTADGSTEVGVITENDFDFFDDGPGQDHDPVPEAHTTAQISAAPDAEAQSSPETQADVPEQVVEVRRDAGPDAGLGTPEPPVDPPNASRTFTEPTPEAIVPPPTPPQEAEDGPNAAVSNEEQVLQRPGQTKRVTFVEPTSSVPIESVPSPFAPLDIVTTVPSIAYSLPTPAASPESGSSSTRLRGDLLARLQSSLQDKKKFDYAADWDLGSDGVSDMETEEDLSGAPPTPISLADSEILPSVLPTPKVDSRGENEQISWEDVNLVGPEWVGIRWDEGVPEGSGRTWKDSWAKDKVQSQAEEERLLVLENCDEERLVGDLVLDRHLRNLILRGLPREVGIEHDSTLEATTDGHSTSPLAQTRIHVGFEGKVCQVSIAALRYWRQLGLQPVGGPKDIRALAVCTPDPGSVKCAKEFLGMIGSTYEAYHLGKHTLGEAAAAEDGIIAVPVAGLVASVAALLPNALENTVVYVLLPLVPPDALSILVAKVLSTTVPTSDTAFVKLIAPISLDVHEAASTAFEVYEKFPRPIRPIQLRGMPMEIPESHSYVQYPSWTIAESAPVRPELTLNWPLRSYDVLNRWRMVHAAYAVDSSSKRAVGYITDAQGEGWATKTVSIGENGIEVLWTFFKDFATRCSAEYRLIVCAVSTASRAEVDAWKVLMDASKLPASFVFAEPSYVPHAPDLPRNPVPIPPTTFIDPAMRLQDDSLSGALSVLPRFPVRTSETDLIVPRYAFSVSVDSRRVGKFHVIHHSAPDRMSGLGIKAEEKEAETEEDVVQVLGGSYYRMACFGRMRGGMDGGPVHVEAVRMGLRALEMVK